MAEKLDVGNLAITLLTAPPVYEPGGPVAAASETDEQVSDETLAAAETEAAKRDAVLLMVPCRSEQAELADLLKQRGFQAASAWFRGPTGFANRPIPANIRCATGDDVSALLTIGEEARRQKARYSPVFWKMTASPKETFAAYVTMQVENDNHIALIYEEQGTVIGYCVAQNDYVDDFAVAVPTQWATVGKELLQAVSDAAFKRGVVQLIIVAPDGDSDKCDAITGEGFTRFRRWCVKPLEKVENDS